MSDELYLNRKLNATFLNVSQKILDTQRLLIEKKIQAISSELNIKTIRSLEEVKNSPCDLLIVAANHIPEEEFNKWLSSFSLKIETQGYIWIPALIISQACFPTLMDVLSKAVQMNWYFDIVHENHLDSIPIRVANLLRIHDHLHELNRYESSLDQLSKEIEMLKSSLSLLEKKNPQS